MMKQDFWDEKYKKEDCEWGKEPSFVGELAAKIMRENNLKTVLDIGCGYGRDCIHLATQGFGVTGIDTSSEGLRLAREWARQEELEMDLFEVDITKNHFQDGSFDTIVMYNTLHLMDERKRDKTVKEVWRLLKEGGIFIQVVMSSNDKEFGKGIEVENNTFDFKGGRPLHFYSRGEIENSFQRFNLIRLEEVDIHESHSGGREHHHKEWLIIAEKPF